MAKTVPKGYFEEEYDIDLNSPEAISLISTEPEKLSVLVETKSLESLARELSSTLGDLDLMKEKMLELVDRLAETEEIPEVRKIAAEMEKILKEK